MAQRRWRITASDPHALQLAADARISATDFTDDQSWEIALDTGDAPAFALRTGLGGRVGLMSLVPMWIIENRPIYLHQGYVSPPVVTRFAPGFAQLEAKLTPTINLRIDVWVIESHALGVGITLKNTASTPVEVTLRLVGFAAANNRELPVKAANILSNTLLSFGQIAGSFPLVMLENGAIDTAGQNIGAAITLPARGTASARFIHTATDDLAKSINLAKQWLAESWNKHVRKIARVADAVPSIETGDPALDAVIAFSYQQVMQAFIKPTSFLPHASVVATRQPSEGYSPRGDGGDMPRSWSGQGAHLAYLTALAAASVDKTLAQGIVRNYLAVQRGDGWIDAKPGLGGGSIGVLCPPILARLAWNIWQYTQDDQFLAEVFSPLMRFFTRWFEADQDADGDGFPEWSREAQMGYSFFPTFAQGLPFGQNADVKTVESPDLIAYLLSEATSLREMAVSLGRNDSIEALSAHITRLTALLDSLWNDTERRYQYRDRDTHLTTTGQRILSDARADEDHVLALDITPPNRLIIIVRGGAERTPHFTLTIEGRAANGSAILEKVTADDFVWSTGRGVYTTRAAFAVVDRLRADGLVSAYRLEARTLDTTGFDLNGVLPLWSKHLSPERTRALIDHITNPDHFWRTNGVLMASAQNPHHDPDHAVGSLGVWGFYVTLIGEALLEAGDLEHATDLTKKLLGVQARVLRDQKAFYETYHADEPRGMGERGNIMGAAPLHLLIRVLGVRILSKTQVHTGGAFVWGNPVTVTQHGVSVRRTAEETTVTFPSGNTVKLPADAEPQFVTDKPLTTTDS